MSKWGEEGREAERSRKGRAKGEERSKWEARVRDGMGQAAPFIVGQAYLAGAR